MTSAQLAVILLLIGGLLGYVIYYLWDVKKMTKPSNEGILKPCMACIFCEVYDASKHGAYSASDFVCEHPAMVERSDRPNYVTGEVKVYRYYPSCESARGEKGCGKRGKYFHKREEKQ